MASQSILDVMGTNSFIGQSSQATWRYLASRNPSGGRTDLVSKDGSIAVGRNATRAKQTGVKGKMVFFPQTEEKVSWYLNRALKKRVTV